ncbi:MAG: hypothetical protein D3915_06345 [Candidatus Electrothrix sp. AU1_5]|nr:hypothetical protein [Candidatus Electrothrix gigas]
MRSRWSIHTDVSARIITAAPTAAGVYFQPRFNEALLSADGTLTMLEAQHGVRAHRERRCLFEE